MGKRNTWQVAWRGHGPRPTASNHQKPFAVAEFLACQAVAPLTGRRLKLGRSTHTKVGIADFYPENFHNIFKLDY